MGKRVADVLVDTLAAHGVERIYGLAGDSLNGITDSIRARESMRWVHVRHEETAAFAAGAEAHLTGRECNGRQTVADVRVGGAAQHRASYDAPQPFPVRDARHDRPSHARDR